MKLKTKLSVSNHSTCKQPGDSFLLKSYREKIERLLKFFGVLILLTIQQNAQSQQPIPTPCACGEIVFNADCPGHDIFYKDSDNDGYGNPTAIEYDCNNTHIPPHGYVKNNSDGDDNNPSIHPGTYYADADGDRYGDANNSVSSSFNKAFPLAENVKWTEDAKGYLVSFTQFSTPSKVIYDPQGEFVYALRYYKEENLPVSIILAVRERFADKKISGVTEESTQNKITYHLRLEDSKSWYGIAVTTSGSITLEKHFQKSN
jgi:hypothetical protein